MAKNNTKEPELTEEQKNNQLIEAFLKHKDVKDHHFNFEDPVEYCVSTGSLGIDYELEGFGPGFHRFFGPTESGKTSEALAVMKNMIGDGFNKGEVPKSKGLFVKAEGRLSQKLKDRSGLKFVTDPKEWVHGTCFVFICNKSEIVFKFLENVLANTKYKDGTKICGVLDSTDGLITANALTKDYGKSAQVAGGATQASHFAKMTALACGHRGHMLFSLSQIRENDMKIDRTPPSKQKKAGGSGGNALMHYPDHIWEFLLQRQDDFFLKNGGEFKDANHKTNPIIGHNVRFKTLKTPNEKTNMIFEYPVKYGKGIWVEREVLDFLISWEFIEKRGSWFSFSKELREEADKFIEDGDDLPEKVQGMEAVYSEFESRDGLALNLFGFCKKTIKDSS